MNNSFTCYTCQALQKCLASKVGPILKMDSTLSKETIESMKQPITGYHKDKHDDWVAKLQCGHNQHVRHNPPWQLRPWATAREGRESRLGNELNCKKMRPRRIERSLEPLIKRLNTTDSHR